MLLVLMLASILLEVSTLKLDDLLQPRPELSAGELDLLLGKLVEHDGDLVLKLLIGVVRILQQRLYAFNSVSAHVCSHMRLSLSNRRGSS